jgi:hypothetical protein
MSTTLPRKGQQEKDGSWPLEVRHRRFIYTTFDLDASHTGLWAYGLG